MPFDYFESLSAKNKRIYRASDAVAAITLPDAALEGLRRKTRRLRGALASEAHAGTQAAARELVRALCESLTVPAPQVRVHEVRPSGDYGELHGLYTRWEDGRARLEVWMRTAVNQQPVAFRTFLRTLAHEVAHHLDYVHLALADSFHTEGFFKRESSLVRQLDVAPREPVTRRAPRTAPSPDETRQQRLERLRSSFVRGRPRPEGSQDAEATLPDRGAQAGATRPVRSAQLTLDLGGEDRARDARAPERTQPVSRIRRA